MQNSIGPRDIANFFSPNRIMLGAGAAKEIGSVAKSMGARKALVITDPGVANIGLGDEIKESLTSQNLNAEIFDRVELEPPARVVDECAKFIREGGFDLIVGLGGGSSMDTAKMASVMAMKVSTNAFSVSGSVSAREFLNNVSTDRATSDARSGWVTPIT